ncbi:hypothetical protein Cob_v009836 [Colletotrichum orbiculare MAFF 240422]|uniref:SH3 domain-containing protein n=1 Tax=Colletotrichum orbiculare (strain 104-T / ATCC 96160 / CBS 514.97 / LARS 414 / MAFF 240422) TaxID=1213857 RepID=A0A484FHU6_COLOR|nr:hypothetical protein Cob_v009836 [Colletotrichum orbiculare MAFF 240422]
MAHHSHGHRHLPRNPDFWTDVGDKFKNLNPFASEDENSSSGGNGNGGRTVVKTIYQTVTDGPATTTSSRTRLIVAQSPLPTRSSSSTTEDSGTTIAKNGAPVAQTPQATASENASSTALPSVIEEPLTTESIPATLAVATDEPTLFRSTKSAATANIASAASTQEPTSTAVSDKATTNETSGAAKAGIAIGVLAGVLVVFLLVFFLFNRRKKQLQQQRLADEDEKMDSSFGTAAGAAAGNPRAPRISLRPVTQFLPNLSIDKRASRVPNTNANLAPSAALGARAPGQSAWDRPATSQHANPANPFGAQAERINGPIVEEPVSSMNLNEKPLPSVNETGPVDVGGPPAAGPNGAAIAAGAAVAAGDGAVAAAGLVRKASTRKDGPKALDLTLPVPQPLSTVPASPAGTEYSANSAPCHQPTGSTGSAAIAAAGGPANTTVHRVQLDFKPTLEDEMELRAGQLVRLLHEYDDGWALCIRLDRSQQGVVPRTCLSTRPVKPRPPPGQGPRGPPMGPNGQHRGPGPNFPPGQRPMTPQGAPYGGPPYPRPESPARPMTAGGRPQSPGPRFQGPPGQRPQSPGGHGRKPSPPGPSRIPQPSRMNPGGSPPQGRPGPPGPPGPPMGPVGRKPVPGQAV